MAEEATTNQKKKLTKQQLVALIIAGALLVFGITVAIATRQGDGDISKNGVETTAVSTGENMQTREGGRRGGTVYKARYSFEVDGSTRFVYGEKEYASADEIKEGKTVKVKYLASDPLKAIVSGE